MPQQELQTLLDEYLHTQELQDARELGTHSGDELRAHLEEAYWRAARTSIAAAVTEPPAEILQLDAECTALVDYAWFDHSTLQHPQAEPARFGVMHSVLNNTYRVVLRMPLLERLRARHELISRDIREWPETHLLHVRFRDRRCLELFEGGPHAQQVLRLFSEMDEQLEHYVRLERRMRAVRSPDARDAGQWREVREFMTTRRDGISKYTAPLQRKDPEGVALLEASAEAVIESVADLLELQAVRRDVEGELAETEHSRRNATAAEVRAALHTELADLRALLRLAARYARVPEMTLPLPGVPLLAADELARALSHVLAFDPMLLKSAPDSRFDTPQLLLAPGTGLGVYDPARNRFVIPRRCPADGVASIAHAAVMFRLHIDQEEHDGALLESYRKAVHDDGRPRSKLKLKNAFVRDYLDWMTVDSTQGGALAHRSRGWFESTIAPAADEPWLPDDLVGLPASRVTTEMRRLSQMPESADRQYRRALLEWLNGTREADALKASVLPAIDEAARLAPQSAPIVYSAAVLHMRAGSFQRALDHFAAFTALQPFGWRARKAAELCARCR